LLRFSISTTSRQIWLDDRLVAEAQMSSPKEAFLSLLLTKGAQVLSCDIQSTQGEANGRFVPLALAHYSHAKNAQPASDDATRHCSPACPCASTHGARRHRSRRLAVPLSRDERRRARGALRKRTARVARPLFPSTPRS